MERAQEGVPLLEPRADGVGGLDDERRRLAQREQPEHVIEVAVREEDRADRRVARGARVERRRSPRSARGCPATR